MTGTVVAEPVRRRWRPAPTAAAAVAVTYVSAQLMAAIDMNIVNTVLPTLSRQFSASLSAVQWSVIAYLLALAVLIPASGWVGERVGLKRTFICALALFTAASALCGSVDSLGGLIAARALQGAGGGMMIPTGTAMLYRAYPPERRARLSRMLIVPILIGPGVAPLLGGTIAQLASWRWVFLINIPVGIVTLLFALRCLPADERDSEPDSRLDLAGMVMSGLGLSSLLFAVSEGPALGWDSPSIIASGVGGVALLTAFTRHSLRRPEPILRIRLLGDRLFRSTNIVFALTTGSFLGSLYLTPIFLQEVLGQSPLSSGSTTFLEALGVALGAQTLARLYPRVGPRVLATLGGLILTLYLGLFLLVVPGTNLWFVRGLMLLGGLGNGAAFLALQTAMFTTISRRDLGHASAIYNTQRQSTIAFNVAILTTIVAAVGGSRVDAFHWAYLVAACAALLGAGGAWRLISTDAARSTMRRPPRPVAQTARAVSRPARLHR
jgi:EmrB/QacA subfamily drug resistance transporter